MKYYAISEDEAKRHGIDVKKKDPIIIWWDMSPMWDMVHDNISDDYAISSDVEDFVRKSEYDYQLKDNVYDKLHKALDTEIAHYCFDEVWEAMSEITHNFTGTLTTKDFKKIRIVE